MKKILYILVALIFAGCTSDERIEYDPELTLMFQPGMYMHVSHDNVEGFTDDRNFAVKAWALPRGARWSESWANASEYLPTSVAYCKKSQKTEDDGTYDNLWSVADHIRWPDAGTTLTFIGYSPVSARCECTSADGVVYMTDALTEQTDFLYTQPCLDREKSQNGGVVPLIFEHAMCRIDLRAVRRVADDEKITVKRISFDDVLHKGTFTSLPSPKWTLDDSYKEIVLFEGSEELASSPAAIGRYLFLPPQKLVTHITVEYEYTSSAQATIPLKQKTTLVKTALKAGHTYTYTLSVGIDDVRFLQEIIN